MTTLRDLELTFVAVLQAKAGKPMPPHQTADVAREMMRNGRRLKTLAVQLCNGEVTQEQYEKKSKRPAENIKGAASALGLPGVILGGDPRGCVAKLKFPFGYSNDFGGEGFCIPGA